MTIDWWTLGIQTVNVAVLVWLLQRFFWRPVSAMIAKRRDAAQAALTEAQAKDDKAKASLAEIAKTRAGFAAEHAEILKQAHAAAEQATAATLAATALKVTSLEKAGAATIAASSKAAEAAWADRSSRLAVEIAAKLAARLDGPTVQQRFLAWLVDHLRGLPNTVRNTTKGSALEIVSSGPIDQAATGAEIAKALGTTPKFTFRIDSSLIAGLEPHGGHLDVTNSWQADLARILSETKVTP